MVLPALHAGLLVLLVLTACGESPPNYPNRQMPTGLMADQDQLAAGRTLFMAKCASCHGKPSEGRSGRVDFFSPPAPDFTAGRFREIDPAYLYWRIETGKNVEPYRSQGSAMPAWGMHLSDQQIWQLVGYLQLRAE